MYNSIVRDHFSNPRNVGEIDNPDRTGYAKNSADGDIVQLHLKIENNRIKDIRMKVMGCVAAIASTSLLTEWVKGMSIEKARSITREQLNDKLGGLPEQKIRCSLTCIDALQDALKEDSAKGTS